MHSAAAAAGEQVWTFYCQLIHGHAAMSI